MVQFTIIILQMAIVTIVECVAGTAMALDVDYAFPLSHFVRAKW